MASVTLTTLRTRVRERADMVGSSFVADAATGLDAWINEGVQRLHGMLVDAMGEEYVSSSAALTTVVNQSDYALPTGFFKLYGVDYITRGETHSLVPYMRSERNIYKQPRLSPRGPPRYSLVGSNLRLLPAPQEVTTGAILFAPEATALVNASDAVNFPNGWERYVVLYAAIQALLKEESSASGLKQELAEVEKEIERTKEMRDLAMPKQVVDMDAVDFRAPWFYE